LRQVYNSDCCLNAGNVLDYVFIMPKIICSCYVIRKPVHFIENLFKSLDNDRKINVSLNQN
jgi:hypothetical protein